MRRLIGVIGFAIGALAAVGAYVVFDTIREMPDSEPVWEGCVEGCEECAPDALRPDPGLPYSTTGTGGADRRVTVKVKRGDLLGEFGDQSIYAPEDGLYDVPVDVSEAAHMTEAAQRTRLRAALRSAFVLSAPVGTPHSQDRVEHLVSIAEGFLRDNGYRGPGL